MPPSEGAGLMASHTTPMTLGNMQEQGVRSLSVHCVLCHHSAAPRMMQHWADKLDTLRAGDAKVVPLAVRRLS
jgi:hypothetical protein